MDTPAAGEPANGDSLCDIGWRQGALFSAPSARRSWITTKEDGTLSLESPASEEDPRYIVISQDCDIEHVNLEDEPFIEALRCAVVSDKSRNVLKNWERNSPRFFPLDVDSGLIVLATQRIQISKEVLSQLKPEPWPYSLNLFTNFRKWLGRRYTRPAFPDEFNESFANRVIDALRQMKNSERLAFSESVREVRVKLTLPGEYPFEPHSPYDPQLLIITESDELDPAGQAVIQEFNRKVKALPFGDNIRFNPEIQIADPAHISMDYYYATTQLPLDYYTNKGEDMEGAQPLER